MNSTKPGLSGLHSLENLNLSSVAQRKLLYVPIYKHLHICAYIEVQSFVLVGQLSAPASFCSCTFFYHMTSQGSLKRVMVHEHRVLQYYRMNALNYFAL